VIDSWKVGLCRRIAGTTIQFQFKERTMPVKKSTPGRNMGATNKDLRTEITSNLITGLKVTDISRTKDSVLKSPNFHLDSKEINGNFKVEIQFQKGKKQTVAVVQVAPGANDADLRTGLSNSLKDGCTYLVS
jgi:hypothetical protein